MATAHWTRRPRGGGRVPIRSQPAPDPPAPIGEGDDDDDGIPIFLSDEDELASSLTGGGDQSTATHQNKASSSAVDPTRAPKVAAFLLLAFFVTCGVRVNYYSGGDGARQASTIRTKSSLSVISDGEEVEDEDDVGGTSVREGASSANATASIRAKPRMAQPTIGNFKLPRVDIDESAAEVSNYADVTDPMAETDVPLFWHVPRSGGSTVKDVAAVCLGLTLASEAGAAAAAAASAGDGGEGDDALELVEDVDGGGTYVNVDTTSPDGIARAAALNLAGSGLADVVFSPYLFRAGALFDPDHRGRVFTLLRHPVERAVSMYYHLRSDPDGQKLLKGMSLEKYASSPVAENNWMTRFLSNRLAGELTPEHEAIAREILRRKCLVGLLSEKGKSMERFERFFGWDDLSRRGDPERVEECKEKLLDWDWSNKNKHPRVVPGSSVWEALEEINTFDVRLYNYAVDLFHMQEIFFTTDAFEK